MSALRHNHDFAHGLLGHLAALGVRHVCLSPGSRSTPLALAAAAISHFTVHVHHDERVSAFFGLGIAKAAREPVALISTSGTAAVEFSPAVAEALYSQTPLIVLTSDRPPELQDVGAPQTIDQHGLYGSNVKWSSTTEPPSQTSVATAAAFAEHAMIESLSAPPGPVHINVRFREPLEPPLEYSYGPEPQPRTTVAARRHPTPAELTAISDRVIGRSTLFVVGATSSEPGPIGQLAVDIGAAVFADITSDLRTATPPSTLVRTADPLAAVGALDLDPPEVVVRWGGLPTSKPVWSWLERHPDVEQIVIDDAGRLGTGTSARLIVNADPAATAQTLVGEGIIADKAFAERWTERDAIAGDAVQRAIHEDPFPTEPLVASLVASSVRPGARIFAGSSMPIRDLDLVASDQTQVASTFGNRGINGIDGSISTALGAATQGPVVALIGDVAALYDLGGIAAAARSDLDLTIVVVHNDGGGIFAFLPQADPAVVPTELFERVFGAPHGTDFIAVANALGLPAASAVKDTELIARLRKSGPQLVEVRTDRAENVVVHDRIRAAVADALG